MGLKENKIRETKLIYNPLDKFYKSKRGAISTNERLTLRVKGQFDSVVLLIMKDGESDCFYQMQKCDGYFEVSLILDAGLYFYCFRLPNGTFIGVSDDMTGEVTRWPERFQLIVYSSDYRPPNWINGGIIYQIFPDRFCRAQKDKKIGEGKILRENWLDAPFFLPNEKGEVLNNDFFGGDIKGIISKLDYLKKLNVTTIYLNPIFEAYSNHRYDTGDYMKIDSLLGDENDLVNLIKSAKKLGINIILDGVFNHTGDDSVYFNKYNNYDSVGAYQSKQSEYYKWYNFFDYPNGYDSWWGIKTLPAINEDNEDYINFIAGENGVIEHYTKLGIKGWRLDVVDELPDFFVKKITEAVKRVDEDAIVIGEVWEDASNKIAYGVRREYFQGKELDSVMNYPLKNAILEYVNSGKERNLSKTIKVQIDHYPEDVLHSLMNLLSTHDTFRLLSAVSGENMYGKSKSEMLNAFIPLDKIAEAKFRLKVASMLQYTLCGVPSVYYGDEIGIQGYTDPLNRRCYPWGQEDKELLSWYIKLGEIRTSYSVFANGEYEEVCAENGVFMFTRSDENSQILVCVNLGDGEYKIEYDGLLTDLLTLNEYENCYELLPKNYAILINKSMQDKNS